MVRIYPTLADFFFRVKTLHCSPKLLTLDKDYNVFPTKNHSCDPTKVSKTTLPVDKF